MLDDSMDPVKAMRSLRPCFAPEAYRQGRNLYLHKNSGVYIYIAKSDANKKIVGKVISYENFREVERDIMRRLPDHHRSIKYIGYSQCPHSGQHTIFMEKAETDLHNYLNKNRLGEDDIRRLFRQMVEGVKYLHESNVVHRDLKPENIFIMKDGNAKIGDFGHSRLTGEGQLIKGGKFGTPCFAPPEMHLRKDHNRKVDIWGLGILLYCLYNRYGPFDVQDNDNDIIKSKILAGDINISGRRPTPLAINLIRGLLNRDPNERPEAEDILDDVFFRS